MRDEELRNRLIERIPQLSPECLLRLAQLLSQMECTGPVPPSDPARTRPSRTDLPLRDWPHAPVHRLSEHGTFLVTAGTLHKHHHFPSRQRLDLLQAKLAEGFRTAEMKARLAGDGAEPVVSTPAEFAMRIKSEIEKWSVLAKAAKIQPEE